LDALRESHHNVFRSEGSYMGIGTSPKFGIGQQNEAAGIAALLGELREMRARFVHELLRQADGDMRRGTELAENLDDELLDFGERFALDQRGGEFLRDGYRDLDRFGF